MNPKALPAPPRLDDDTPARPRPRISDRLSQAIDQAVASVPRDVRGRNIRCDGWTPERIRTFLETLAETGNPRDAARAAGMSRSSAYAFRRRAEGRHFAAAWDGAMLHARPVFADELMSRAMHGYVEIIVRDGKVWGERHRFDNRAARAMLTRLDRKMLALDGENAKARIVANAFDRFVEIVCAGGEGAEEFFRAQAEAAAGPDGAPHGMEIRFVSAEPE